MGRRLALERSPAARHVLWPFIASFVRILIAAGGGWLAVRSFGGIGHDGDGVADRLCRDLHRNHAVGLGLANEGDAMIVIRGEWT
jgi:hypothetical protein